MTKKQYFILNFSKRFLMWRIPTLYYGMPPRRWKRILSAVFWGYKPKYDFVHGNVMIGHKLIHKHIPMHLLSQFVFERRK